MIHHIFSVYDSKAGAYTQPFYAVNARVAIRMFTELANDPKHTFGTHPEDFTLFELGTFDDATAQIIQVDVKSSAIGKAIEYKRKTEQYDPEYDGALEHFSLGGDRPKAN